MNDMKITVYTISDCYFSKQEKDYLQTHNLAFEEKNLEENRDYLTEMLTISNNFAGTPVTKIEKDDGQIFILKGFTREDFDKTFGIHDEPAVQDTAAVAVPSVPSPAPSVSPPVDVPPLPDLTQPTVPQAPPPSQPAPVAQSPDVASIEEQIAKLKALQESLAAKMQTPPTTSVSPPTPAVPAYQPPPVQSPAPSVAPPVQTQSPTTPAPAQTSQTPAVDDSLAAILAELQSKINSSQSGGAPGTPPTTT